MVVSRWVLVCIGNVVEEIKTHILGPPSPESHAIYDVM
jgi:hypothetical protein